jgi:hypothetical protein
MAPAGNGASSSNRVPGPLPAGATAHGDPFHPPAHNPRCIRCLATTIRRVVCRRMEMRLGIRLSTRLQERPRTATGEK